jgi:UDP-N-acetylmuramate dehydrogenase
MMVADFDLSHANTLALPGIAAHAVVAQSVDDVRRGIDVCLSRDLSVEVLGEGSNVVVQPRVPGCVLLPRLEWIRCESVDDRVRVSAGAGVHWNDLVRHCIAQRWHGLENLALIPGTVGAAPIQNIGAYGVEMESRFDYLDAVSCADGRVVRFDRDACEFAYRESLFKRSDAERFVIVEVGFLLDREFTPVTTYPDVSDELARMGARVDAVSIAEAVVRVRRRKLPDPRRVPNAGSFFKNPVVDARTLDRLRAVLGPMPVYPGAAGTKVSAARLIEAGGWKGRTFGRAGVWPRQPLVLVNLGGATSADVLGLADAIADDVATRFGVVLEREPRLLGRPLER